jgi:hypothetical protein
MAVHPVTDRIVDPADLLGQAFEHAWEELCAAFDVHAQLPDLQELLDGGDLGKPGETAQQVFVNMLLEIMGCVSRFSPWYRQPARAYGLVQVKAGHSSKSRWGLAPEAVQKWQGCLDILAVVIRKNSGLIQAILYVDGLMTSDSGEEAEIVVSCRCLPPRRIQVRRSMLEQADIVCDACLHPFS